MMWWRALAVGVALLGFATVASAQGAGSVAPDPIGLAELHLGISTRVAEPLTSDEWLAIERAHDAYLTAARTVREGIIESALQRLDAGDVTVWIDVDALRDLARSNDAIAGALSTIDGQLFDAVAGVLGDARQTIVQSLRDCRAAVRASQSYPPAMLDTRSSISDAFRTATTLSADDRARIEPALRAFEAREPKLIKAAKDATSRRAIHYAELVKNANLDPNAPDVARWTALREQCDAETPDYDEANNALFAAHDKFIADAFRQIPFDAQREVRHLLYRDTRLSSGPSDPACAEQYFRAALRSKRLSDDQRRVVRELYERWAGTDDKLVDALRIEARALHPRDLDPLQRELRDKRMNNGIAARQQIVATVPKEVGQAINECWRIDPFDLRAPEDMKAAEDLPLVRRAATRTTDGSENIARYRMRWQLPATNATVVIDWLNEATPQDQVTVTNVLGDVREAWDRDIVPLISRGAAMDHVAWRADSTDEEIQQSVKAKFEALDAAERLDRTIFEGLNAAMPPAHLPAVNGARVERMLTIWADGESLMGLNTAWETEFLPNFARLVRTAAAVESRVALSSILTEESDALLAAAQSRRREGFRLTALAAIAMMRSMDSQGDRTPEGLARFNRLRDQEKEAGDALVALRRTSADEFRRVLARMLDAVPESNRSAFRMAYEREARPDLFFDPRTYEQFYDRALTSPSMSDEQKASVRRLRGTFDEKLAALVFAWIDAIRAKPVYGRPNENGIAQRRREAEFFQRNEISERAILALRRELGDKERARIHGLDSYERLVARLSGEVWDD